ncbi:MAG: branched-chain amino acid ABC transporter substrate-binding protein [Chloroflexi bacterium]|nr:branched-chain amino acid ABC transporter substrate-binding protein [Chloroflexota bacterium]
MACRVWRVACRGLRHAIGHRRYAICTLILVACSSSRQSGASLAIYASLPLSGPEAARAQALVNGIQLKLAEHDQAACGGRFGLRFVPLDNTTNGEWDATLETAAANKAANDPNAAAFVGSFEPAPLQLSLPILNRVNPLLVVTPMNTYTGLSRRGLQAADPAQYYFPAEWRIARLGPTDDQIGESAARWASRSAARTVFVLYDEYDPDLQAPNVARAFEHAATGLGLIVVGSLPVNRFAAEYDSIMYQIQERAQTAGLARPDLLFYAGPTSDHLGRLFAAKKSWLGDNHETPIVIAPGFEAEAFVASAGDSVEGTIVISPDAPPTTWPPDGRRFAQAYSSAYSVAPTIAAAYGYEAADLIQTAINVVCASGGDPRDRDAVRQTALAARDFPGALGRWSLDNRGDLSSVEFGIYRVNQGMLEFLEKMRWGE